MYRNAVWLVKGLREYTKNGYLSAAKKFKTEDLDVDCSGRAFMITGANSGIGKQVCLLNVYIEITIIYGNFVCIFSFTCWPRHGLNETNEYICKSALKRLSIK